jgi:hypothetical protein
MGAQMGRRIAVLIALAAMIIGTVAAVPAGASSLSDETTFARLVNQERAARGLSQLTLKTDLASVARRHSQDMAASGGIYHNSNLGSEVDGWRELGENVGSGYQVDKIHDAFMNSEHHRANILHSTFNQMGIGVAYKGDQIYVTQVFAKRTTTSTTTTKTTTTTTVTRTVTRARSVASEPSPRIARTPAPTAPVVAAPSRAVSLLADLASFDAEFAMPDAVLPAIAA